MYTWSHERSECKPGAKRKRDSAQLRERALPVIMKPFAVILLVTISVQAQTIADVARKERERQARFRSKQVIVNVPSASSGASKPEPSKEETKPAPVAAPVPPAPKPAAPDLTKSYNDQVEKLRARIRDLQDQETALQLQINQLTNRIYAPVVDPAAKDQAQNRLGATQQQLTSVRAELDQTKKTLDAMLLQGPPKQ